LALSIEPEYPEALLNLGEIRAEQGLFDDAVSHLRRASRLRPRAAAIHLDLANALHQIGDHTHAVQSYQRALSFQASSFSGWMGLGQSNAALERWADAISSFKNAIALQPGSAAAHLSLGQALQSAGQPDEAARHLAVASVLGP
jgi:cytochrome c-type biogenesis protein CcmH/NrfG